MWCVLVVRLLVGQFFYVGRMCSVQFLQLGRILVYIGMILVFVIDVMCGMVLSVSVGMLKNGMNFELCLLKFMFEMSCNVLLCLMVCMIWWMFLLCDIMVVLKWLCSVLMVLFSIGLVMCVYSEQFVFFMCLCRQFVSVSVLIFMFDRCSVMRMCGWLCSVGRLVWLLIFIMCIRCFFDVNYVNECLVKLWKILWKMLCVMVLCLVLDFLGKYVCKLVSIMW